MRLVFAAQPDSEQLTRAHSWAAGIQPALFRLAARSSSFVHSPDATESLPNGQSLVTNRSEPYETLPCIVCGSFSRLLWVPASVRP